MSEVKSTLDLVMEKTRHLSLSPEEKAQQAIQEARKQVQGMLRKYQDGILNLQQLGKELNTLAKQTDAPANDLLVEAAIAAAALNADNEPLWPIFEHFGTLETGPLKALLQEYRAAAAAVDDRLQTEAREHLAAQYGISGPAVVPNLNKSRRHADEAAALQRQFDERLEAEKACLKKKGAPDSHSLP